MKIKKIVLICGLIIILISLSIFIFLNIKVNRNINKNEIVINTFNNIFKDKILEVHENFDLPKLQIEDTDYIGIINISKYDILIPVESKCNNTFLNIQSSCNYKDKSFVILGTNLKDSFSSYETFDVDDEIIFTNMLGRKFQYKIKKIKRINSLDLSQYDEELIIVIKNYYSMEYILFICDSY